MKHPHSGWTQNLISAGAVREGERTLVVVDEPLAEEGSQLVAALVDAGAEARLELWAGERPLARAPDRILEAARTIDAYFFLCREPLGEEAGARIALMEEVTGRGGRAMFLGLVDRPLLEGELSRPAPDLTASARALLRELEGSSAVRVRGSAGTDLTLRCAGRPWKTDALPLGPGDVANFPSGEVFVAPLADGADGTLVADLTVPYTVEGLVDQPVVLRFQTGRVTSIEGGQAAAMLRELVEKAGPGGDVIAELGLGINPTITPRGHVMLDEKAARTAHVAIGKNTGAYGGDNEASIHVDCVFSEPTLEADGRTVQLP
jgi:hypothetical protein